MKLLTRAGKMEAFGADHGVCDGLVAKAALLLSQTREVVFIRHTHAFCKQQPLLHASPLVLA